MTAPESPPRLLLTPEEAAVVLGVGRTTLYGLLAAGALASVQIGRPRRVPVAALDRYVEGLVGGGADKTPHEMAPAT